jgi:hypothetical protein
VTRCSFALNSVLAILTTALALVLAFQYVPGSSTRDSTLLTKTIDASPKPRDWQTILAPHLQTCHDKVNGTAKVHLEPVVDLLNRARNRTPDFASVALGFGSKWRLMVDYVPFTKGDRNETFLKEEFENRVLRGADLEHELTQAIESFLREMRSLEGEMLVAIRADIEDFPEIDASTWTDEELLREKFEGAIQAAMLSSDKDFHSAIGSQLVSLIAGEVLTQVAVRMGVSGGILGAGAASGWATFGIGIVVGVIIDQIVSKVWSYMRDPERDMVVQIQKQLDTLQRLICDGDEDTMGLKQQFAKVENERSELRQQALRSLLPNPSVKTGSLK